MKLVANAKAEIIKSIFMLCLGHVAETIAFI
jgi:hypothetical protein